MNAGLRPVSPEISLEYFPPRTVAGERALVTCAHALKRFRPAFQTVTFGADGGERGTTLSWASTLRDITAVPTATHLTLCAFDAAGLMQHVETLVADGLTRVVLLRGDAVEKGNDGLAGFDGVAGAVRELKSVFDLDIAVAAYPEVHPKASSADEDFDVLLAKLDAGASRAITQFFFDESPFLRLRDRLAKTRPNARLVPGVMPIANFDRVRSFSERCGAAIPPALARAFDRAGSEGTTAVARDFVERQMRMLANEGERSVHVYTMNRIDLTADALRAFEAAMPGDVAAAVA